MYLLSLKGKKYIGLKQRKFSYKKYYVKIAWASYIKYECMLRTVHHCRDLILKGQLHELFDNFFHKTNTSGVVILTFFSAQVIPSQNLNKLFEIQFFLIGCFKYFKVHRNFSEALQFSPLVQKIVKQGVFKTFIEQNNNFWRLSSQKEF